MFVGKNVQYVRYLFTTPGQVRPDLQFSIPYA